MTVFIISSKLIIADDQFILEKLHQPYSNFKKYAYFATS